MSEPNAPGLNNQPDDEVTNLNADELDVDDLQEKLLDEVSGGDGFSDQAALCDNFTCGDYVC